MSNLPRPESRLSEIESKMAIQDARIRELASDTAEELKAIRQDIKDLDKGMMSSFKQIGEHFGLIEKENATKADLTSLETRVNERFAEIDVRFEQVNDRLDRIEATQNNQSKMLQEHGELLKEILERLSSK